jgi:YVTN family beta-propeller protein
VHTHPDTTQRAGTSGRPRLGAARGLAALALAAAAGIHLAQALGHFADGSFHARLHAAFFFAAALFQILAAAALRAGRRPTSAIAAGNLALAGVWVLAVSVGLPGWLVPAGPEPVTLAGTGAAVLEAVAVSLLLASRRPLVAQPAPRWGDARIPVPLVAAVALVVTGWSVPITAQAHRHSADAPHPSPDHGAAHVEGVHLHGLGGDRPDPGPDPVRQARGALVGTRLPAGLGPAAIAVGHGRVWVADREAGLVHRLDTSSGRPLGPPTPVGVHPGGIAVGADAVWVTNAGSDTVSRLDAATGENVGTISVGSVPVGVAVGDGSVWVANSAEGTVSRIDTATGDVVTTPRIGYGPTAITFAAGRPWVVASLDRAVVSLDPKSGAVMTETPVDAGPASIAFGHDSLWVASSSAGTVSRLDPKTGARMGTPIVADRYAQPGQGPAALVVGARVWVLNNHDKTVVAIDPSTRGVSQPQFIDRRVARHITPASIALSDNGQLWATEHDGGLVVRLRPGKDLS